VLLAPPGFLVGPLGGLLAISRPGSVREWIWLGVTMAWMGGWLAPRGDIAEQLLRSFAVLATGSFLAVTLIQRGTPFRRALAALGFAAAALVTWCVIFHVQWPEVRTSITRTVGRSFGELARQADSTAAAGDAGAVLRQMAESAPTWAMLAPALVFLNALVGLLAAWALYHAISRRPLGDPPAPFRSFRFSDQTVWLPVAALALVLFPVAPGARDLGANLLLVAVALYAARGLAVVGAGAGRLPRLTTTFMAIVALFLLPFVVGGLTLLGLADTWLDFRRRPASPATGGFDR
jgi:predicted membrane protein DUF2232